MSAKEKDPQNTYEPPVAEDVEASDGPVATAPGDAKSPQPTDEN